MRLIDADELKKPVGSYNPIKFTHEYGDVIRLEDIDHAPTVDPVQHGRWIDDLRGFEEFAFFRKGWKCSACGSRNTYGKPKHCPNCGARMDGESDE